MRSLTVWVVLAAVAGFVVAGCGPKKEETPQWDPALATSEAAPAITEMAPSPPPPPPAALPPPCSTLASTR